MRSLICFALMFLLFHQGWTAERQDSIPGEILGNWLNPVSQEWEYGFFEEFAIFQSDFWNYKTIKKQRTQLRVTLTKEGQEVDLVLHAKRGELWITSDQGKNVVFHRYPKGFVPYQTPDSLLFGEPELALDSVTILGYYRHLEQVKPEFEDPFGKYEVEVYYEDIWGTNNIEVKAPIDSLGRFRLKIPVYALQSISLDWGKLWSSMVVVPGETMMLCLDMMEFVPLDEEKEDRQTYWGRSKDILFMGDNARLHREMAYCPQYFQMRNMYELIKLAKSHMDYLRLAEGDYQNFMGVFDNFHRKYPTLSGRCVQTVTAEARYKFGSTLMQNRFHVWKNHLSDFDDPAYMRYVKQHFFVDSILYYFLTSDGKSFIRDFTGYYDGLTYKYVDGIGMCKMDKIPYPQALKTLLEQGKLEEGKEKEFEKYIALMDSMLHGKYIQHPPLTPQRVKDSCLLAKYSYLSQEPKVKEMGNVLAQKEALLLYDTLITCPLLKEILIATKFVEDMNHERVALSEGLIELLKEKVHSEVLQELVLNVNESYRKVLEKKICYPQSLKNTDHLNDIQQVDSLWQALLSPYRGKVIYLDFWGTWCDPCKRMMQNVGPVEHAYQSKEVIFMYFAYASPLESWKNVIREYDLSGENIVHYNLAPEQQEMILKYWNINSYPTFMLIDQEGNVVNRQAPTPEQVEELKSEIEKLL